MQPLIKHDESTYERILVIADIHGGCQALIGLLAELQPGQGDLLVTVGHYVDRGPDAKEVLAELRICAAALNTVHLRGNHEGMLLMAMSRSPALPDMYGERVPDDADSLAGKISMWLHNGGLSTLESYCRSAGAAVRKSLDGLKKALRSVPWRETDRRTNQEALIRHCTELGAIIPPEDFSFLRHTCADMLLTGQHILVHGGYDAHFPPKAQQLATLHWGYPAQACTSLHQTLVVGHQIMRTRLPRRFGSLIYLDTGSACVADGRLSCLDLLSQQFWQADQTGGICHSGNLASMS